MTLKLGSRVYILEEGGSGLFLGKVETKWAGQIETKAIGVNQELIYLISWLQSPSVVILEPPKR